MKMILISDTHERHAKVSIPDGDVLVHAGDLTMNGRQLAYKDFFDWFTSLPHSEKVIIPGNHDFGFTTYISGVALPANIHVLLDSSKKVKGLNFYGSPYTPRFGQWAFMMERGQSLYEHWLKIPLETDVLITHGPRHGVLDQPCADGPNCGDEDLGIVIDAVRPKLCVFGHIHGAAGQIEVSGIKYVNASMVNEAYQPVNQPQVVEL